MSVTEQDRAPRDVAIGAEAPAQGRPRRGRPARAHILMTLAGLVTAVGVYVVLQDSDPGQRVLAAAAELQAGTVVPPDALVAVTVDVSEEQAARMIPAEQRDAVVGQVVTNHLMPGDIVGRSDIRQPAAPEDRRAIALPVGRDRAVAGELRIGDRVDVIAVEDGVARYVATGLPVITSGGGDRLQDDWSLTVSADEKDALALARAISEADVVVTRATGATPADPNAVESGGVLNIGEGDDEPRRRRRNRNEDDEESVDGGGDAADEDAATGG